MKPWQRITLKALLSVAVTVAIGFVGLYGTVILAWTCYETNDCAQRVYFGLVASVATLGVLQWLIWRGVAKSRKLKTWVVLLVGGACCGYALVWIDEFF